MVRPSPRPVKSISEDGVQALGILKSLHPPDFHVQPRLRTTGLKGYTTLGNIPGYYLLSAFSVPLYKLPHLLNSFNSHKDL